MNYITSGNENVVIGSGDLYAIKASEVANVFSLTTTEEAELVHLGYIESDAELRAKSTKTTLTAANYGRLPSIEGFKEVLFSTGIMSWNFDNVASFLTGSTNTTEAVTGKQTFVYAEGDRSPIVYLRFVSTDNVAKKKITVNMFNGQFAGELSLVFGNSKPVTFDYSFDLFSKKDATGKPEYFQIITETIA